MSTDIVITFIFYFVRIYTFVRLFEVFKIVSQMRRTVIHMAMGWYIFLLPTLGDVEPVEVSLRLFASLFGEIVIGALMAIAASMPFLVLQSIGQLLDNQRDFLIEGPTNVVTREYSSFMENLMVVLITVLFFHFDLHLLVFEVVFQSYRLLPPGSGLDLGRDLLGFFQGQLSLYKLIVMGLLALFVMLLLVDAGMALIGRHLQGLDIFQLSGGIKSIIVIYVLLQLVGLLFDPAFFDRTLLSFGRHVDGLETLLDTLGKDGQR